MKKNIIYLFLLMLLIFSPNSLFGAVNSTAFRPSAHGWPFENHFPETGGLCGGMCFSALDRFYTETFIPDDIQLPVAGDALYAELFQRQIESLDGGIAAKFFEWQVYRPNEGSTNPYHSIGHLVNTEEWPNIKEKLDANKPTLLGLVRHRDVIPTNIGKNHQVLAYRYELDETTKVLKIWVYDPNYPMNNNVYVQVTLGQPNSRLDALQNTDEPLRGFFMIPYDGTVSDRKIRSMSFNQIRFNKIVAADINARFHQFMLSFSWSGNIFIDYSINRIDNQSREVALDIPDVSGQYKNKRVPQIVGSRDVPINLNDSWGSSQMIKFYMFDKILGSQRVVLEPPYIFSLPFLHDSPYCNTYPDPGWGIKDANINDVVIMQESVTEQEAQLYNNRLIMVAGGEPIYDGVQPGDPDACLAGFRYTDKLGYITSPIYCHILKGFLAENHIETYIIRKTQTGNFGETTISTGDILPDQDDIYLAYNGFSRDDYTHGRRVRATLIAKEFGITKASDEDTFYAKSLLKIESPVYTKWVRNEDFEDIRNRIHEYINRDLLKELIGEFSPDIQQHIKEQLTPVVKQNFINNAGKVWERIQSDPKFLKGIQRIYYNTFTIEFSSSAKVDFKHITQSELKKMNKRASKQAVTQIVAYTKSFIIKQLIDDGAFSKIISVGND